MGFRVRKSINLGGGFRVNISKSGIGYSWGTKGFRVTKTAKGTTRTTTSIPGTGISYVNESGCRKRSSTVNSPASNSCPQEGTITSLENKDLSIVSSGDYKDFVSKLQNIKDLNRFLNIALLVALFFAPYFELPFWLLLIAKIWFRYFKKIHIDYQFEDEDAAMSEMAPFRALKSSEMVWREVQTTTASAPKTDFGISTSAEIEPINKNGRLPFYLKSNIKPVVFQHKKEKFIFFPEKILIEDKSNITALAYEDMSLDFGYVRFLYKDKIPSDTKVVDYKYLHINKDGSPDKRYKDNPQYPICLFCKANFSFNDNIHIHLLCSNSDTISNLEKLVVKQES